MKKILLISALFLVFALAGCQSEPSINDEDDNPIADDQNTDDENNEGLELTLEELALYDGKDGRDAYIAVDGIIYDVTDSSRWSNGTHNGISAGQDLTEEISTLSPHGTSVLDGLPVVGVIVK